MRVLRLHRDSLTAMLEAFIHDPLINWRLLEVAAPQPAVVAAAAAGGAAVDAGAGGATPAPTATARARQGSMAGNSAAPHLSVAGARRLGEANPDVAATLLQQGLAFMRLAEDAALDSALAGVGMTAATQGADATAAHALARSFATSVRAPPPRPPPAREGASNGPEGGGADAGAMPEALNDRAVAVVRRINAKLTGRDFSEDDPVARLMSGGIDAPSSAVALDVPAQVLRLIAAATSIENLALCYIVSCVASLRLRVLCA